MNKGFTLLEMILVLALVTVLFTMGLSFVRKKDSDIKHTLRQFIALNRQLDHFSRLKKHNYRWTIQIDEKESYWWIEKKKTESSSSALKDSAKDKRPKYFIKNDIQPYPGFEMDTQFLKKPQKLPRGMSFDSVELDTQDSLVTEGKIYIPYLPEGQFNKILLNLKYKKKYWSVLIDRLHGNMEVLNTKKRLSDFKSE